MLIYNDPLSVADSKQIRIRTLGSFAVFSTAAGNACPISLRSKKSEAILIFLALETDTPVDRKILSQMLWPDLPADRGRASLRQSLSTIKAKVGPIIVHPNPGWLALDQNKVSCDLWSLRSTDPQLPSQASSAFLSNVPRPTREFDDWLSLKEHAIRAEITKKLSQRLSTGEALVGEELQRYCRFLINLDPLDEGLQLIAVEALIQASEQKEAERLISVYRKQLDDELQVTPSRQFEEKIQSWFATHSPAQLSTREAEPKGAGIAVCALKNLTNDPQLDYFGFAFAEELLAGLSSQKLISVYADELTTTYKPPQVDFAASTDRGQYTLTGSYLMDSKYLRLSVKLTKTSEQEIVWGHTFDVSRNDLFKIQQETVNRVISTVATEVISAETEAAYNDTRSDDEIDEWTRIMRARYLFWRTSKRNNIEARRLLDEGIRQRKTLIPGLTTSAFIRLLDVWSFWSEDPMKDLTEAQTLARKAVKEQPKDPWAYFTLGTVTAAIGAPQGAIAFLDRAMQLHPTFAAAYGELGRVQAFVGDLNEAVALSKKAMALNPQDPHASLWLNTLGLTALLQDQAQTALEWADRAIIANPYWFHHYLLKAAALAALESFATGEEAFKTAKQMAPGLNRAQFFYSHPFQNEIYLARYNDLLGTYSF
jgi:TolB-like protein